MPTSPPIRARAAVAAAFLLVGASAFGQTAAVLHTRALAATCAGCHGTDGNAVQGEAVARLAGLPREHIVTRLQEFRDGKRPATVMHQLSKGYSNEQIEAIAGYFAAQK